MGTNFSVYFIQQQQQISTLLARAKRRRKKERNEEEKIDSRIDFHHPLLNDPIRVSRRQTPCIY